MYDINVKNSKGGNKINYIFLLAGIVFLGILGAIVISTNIKVSKMDSDVISYKVEVKSYINDEGTTMYSPVYYYRVNGDNYTCGSNSSSSIYPGEENKTVYYDSKNPNNCITEYSKSSNKILILVMILPLIFIVVAIHGLSKTKKRVKAILELNQRGKLIKNLPYRMENTNVSVNGVPLQRIVVDYTLPTGSTITLRGDTRSDGRQRDNDGLVDLVIDEQNPDLYFLDFDINRLTGNTPSDYYNPANAASTAVNAAPIPDINMNNPQIVTPGMPVNSIPPAPTVTDTVTMNAPVEPAVPQTPVVPQAPVMPEVPPAPQQPNVVIDVPDGIALSDIGNTNGQ